MPRANPVSDLLDLQSWHWPEVLRELGDDRCTGGSDELMRLVRLADGDALENFQGRRRGQWKATVGALDESPAFMKCGNMQHCDTERFKADTGANDVGDGIQRTDFMEMYFLRRHAMDLPLGHCNALEDGGGMLLYERGKLAGIDEITNLPM